MSRFTVEQMHDLQKQMHEQHKNKWQPNTLATGQDKLMWMLGEVGEVIDILKNATPETIVQTPELRAHFVEEMVDVLMYYNDVLLSFGISPQELEDAYRQKVDKNMTRWQ
ncbi:dATP/dGTP pyrophosphohydrolase domain-containing protein [Streptococcus fryi]